MFVSLFFFSFFFWDLRNCLADCTVSLVPGKVGMFFSGSRPRADLLIKIEFMLHAFYLDASSLREVYKRSIRKNCIYCWIHFEIWYMGGFLLRLAGRLLFS